MALALKLNRTGIDSVGTKMYMSDITGAYDSESNTGGWGTPNPDRADKALLVEAYNNTSEGPVAVALDEYDPETVENFVLNCTADGYYEIIAVAVDKVLPTVEGEYGWTVNDGLVTLLDGVITAVAVSDVYADPLFTEGVSYKTVLLARIAIYRNTKNLDLIKLRMSKFDDRGHNTEIDYAQDEFNTVRSLLEGALYLWCQDNYTESQRVVESFNELIANE